jgi:hypothetical protein
MKTHFYILPPLSCILALLLLLGAPSAHAYMVMLCDTNGNLITPTNLNAGQLKGTLAPGMLPGNVVTNYTHWLLFTNKSAYCNGGFYWFPTSTTAGMNEIQALSPITTNGPSGVCIEIEAADYPFWTPILLYNNTKIKGAGFWASGFDYMGPTNLFTVTDVMNALPQFQGQYPNAHNAGLIQLMTLMTNLSLNTSASLPMNYDFQDFYVRVATNFPCILIAGQAMSIYQDKLGLFGPDVFTYLGGGSELNVSQFGEGTPSTVIGEAVDAWELCTLDDSQMLELADGALNIGNSYFDSMRSGAYLISMPTYLTPADGGPCNGYPTTNWLSAGCAIYSGPNAVFGAHIGSFYPYENNIDIWIDSSPASIENCFWQSSICNIAVSDETPNPFVVQNRDMPMQTASAGVLLENMTSQVWGLTDFPTAAAATIRYSPQSGSPAAGPTYPVLLSSDPLFGGNFFSDCEQINNQVVWGVVAAGTDAGQAPGFYVPVGSLYANLSGSTNLPVTGLATGGTSPSNNWVGTFTGNGGALTNLNASKLVSGLGYNGFEVVVTNTAGPHGFTNYYGFGILTNRAAY